MAQYSAVSFGGPCYLLIQIQIQCMGANRHGQERAPAPVWMLELLSGLVE